MCTGRFGLACERTSKQAFSPLLYFSVVAALCVCDGSPAETKGEELHGC